MRTMQADDRRTILVVDGEPEDQAAIAEAARASDGAGSRLLVLFVPVTLSDWAHWELGDDPLLLRRQIEYDQYRTTMHMLAEAGVDDGYRMTHITSRWRVDELTTNLDHCHDLIVSTSSRLVRRRITHLARRRNVPLRLAPRR